MNKTHLREALESYNKTPDDAQVGQKLQQILQELAVIKLQPVEDKVLIDVEETVEIAAFAVEQGLTSEHGCLTVAQLLAKSTSPTPADPITNAPLRRGKTTTHPIVDWNPVPEDLRLAAGYAAETDQLPPGGSEMAAHSLAQSSLQPPWNRIVGEVAELKKAVASKKATPEQRALLERCEARLFRKPPVAAARPPRAPVIDPAKMPEAPPRATGQAPRIYILADPADARFQRELQAHLYPVYGDNVETNLKVPAGAHIDDHIRTGLQQATAVVVALSADMLANADILSYLKLAKYLKIPMLPWMVRPCLWTSGDLQGYSSLPSDPYQAARKIAETYGPK